MVGTEDHTQRILILAPIGRDASAAAQHLAEGKISCAICVDIEDLHAKLQEGAAAALVTEERFCRAALNRWRNGSSTSPPGRIFRLSCSQPVRRRQLPRPIVCACWR